MNVASDGPEPRPHQQPSAKARTQPGAEPTLVGEERQHEMSTQPLIFVMDIIDEDGTPEAVSGPADRA